MSHFTVGVFTKTGTMEEVEKLLAPFQENNMGDCPKEFLEFVEDEDFDLDEETGKYGYWENPNAKWDWYQVGGRWNGLIILKDGCSGEKGERSWASRQSGEDEYDSARVRDIDFAEMESRAARRLEPFDSCFERKYNPEYFSKKYPNEEVYIKRNTKFSTYAALTPDGEWHSSGTMGWFGIDDSSLEDKNNFQDLYFENFISKAIENDWYLTIVDCHI